ncbi:MAG TPA: hypothetical protein VGM90_39045 [Kofleriaceae bacterium]
MRALLLLLVLSGCVDAALVPCGDLACPASYVCLEAAHRCVSSDQLKSCGSLAAGEDCTVNGTSGKCTDGACTPVICGNGTVDPGEACDDGNQASGDGCSGTCDSDEICGNGKTDVATGEHCDCGDANHLSALCARPNSNDADAECTVDCQPRFCGDGVLGPVEQCDGDVHRDLGCGAFGYYAGELTCSNFCQFTTDACVGRCGDGEIQPLHEYCDGVLPSGGSCVGLGFDLGALKCGVGCSPDLAGCGSLGWTRAHEVSSIPQDLWGGYGRVGVVYRTGDAYVLSDGEWTKAPDQYTQIAGSATTVWALGPDAAARWTKAGGWEALQPPWPLGTELTDAWGSDQLGLFVSETNDVGIDRLVGDTWTVFSGLWGSGARFGTTTSKLWIVDNGITYGGVVPNNAQTYDGTNVVDLHTAADTFVESGTGEIWIYDGSTAHVFGGVGYAAGTMDAGAIAASLDGIYGGTSMHATGHSTQEVYGGVSSPLFFSDLPDLVVGAFASDGRGTLYVGSSSGLFVNRYGEWRNVATLLFGSSMLALPRTPLVAVSYLDSFSINSNGGHVPLGLPEGGCQIAALTTSSHVLAGCPSGFFVDADVIAPGITVGRFWGSRDGNTYALTYGDGVLTSDDGATWTAAITGQPITEIAGDTLDDLYVVISTEQGSSLAHWNGTDLDTLLDGVQGAPMVSATTVYIMKDDALVTYDRATHVMGAQPLPSHATVVTYADDTLFALADSQERGSPLYAFDGSQWIPVRLPEGMNEIGAMTHAGRTLVLQERVTGPVANRPVWFLSRTGPWTR